jgi:hypothetical protein
MVNANVVGALSGLAPAKLPDFSVNRLEPLGSSIFQSDPQLSAQLNTMLDTYHLRDENLCFAIVDLTDDPNSEFGLNNPAYAGVRDTDYRTVASMAKLLALYAAYQLRYDLSKYVRECAGNPVSAIPDIATLANRVRDGYRIINAAESHQDIPLIEKIFTGIAGGSPIDFLRGNESYSVLNNIDNHSKQSDPRGARTYKKLRNPDNLATELNDPSLSPLPGVLYFFEQLRLMASWSNDISAAVVIESLGFPYLWRVAHRSRLFRGFWDPIAPATAPGTNTSGDKGGFYLAGDYWGTHWGNRLVGWSHTPVDAPTGSGGDRDPMNGGTARSAALLLTKLAQNRLVGDGVSDFDENAHNEMREILRKTFGANERGAYSPIGNAFRAEAETLGWSVDQAPWAVGASPPAELAISKLGLLDPDPPIAPPSRELHVSDAVLVRAGRSASSTVPITAVLVGIRQYDSDDTPLDSFGRKAADLLNARHP